jgi:hypothetical protein
MVYGLWFMVYGLWFRVYGLGFMVYGLWFRLNSTCTQPHLELLEPGPGLINAVRHLPRRRLHLVQLVQRLGLVLLQRLVGQRQAVRY